MADARANGFEFGSRATGWCRFYQRLRDSAYAREFVVTIEQMFWEGRRGTPAPPERLDSTLIVVFEHVDPAQRASVLAACDFANANGWLATGDCLTVWIRVESVAAMFRRLGTVPQPVRISIPPTTHLRPDEIDLLNELAGG